MCNNSLLEKVFILLMFNITAQLLLLLVAGNLLWEHRVRNWQITAVFRIRICPDPFHFRLPKPDPFQWKRIRPSKIPAKNIEKKTCENYRFMKQHNNNFFAKSKEKSHKQSGYCSILGPKPDRNSLQNILGKTA